MYESELKRVNSTSASIRYDLTDLFKFIDKFYDVSCLKYIWKYLINLDLTQQPTFINHAQKNGWRIEFTNISKSKHIKWLMI